MIDLPRLALLVSVLLPAGFAAGDYTFRLMGPRNVYRGFDVYIQLQAQFTGGAGNLYFTGASLPPGFSYRLICNPYMEECYRDAKGLFQYGGVAPVYFVAHTASSVSPGDYEIVLTTEASGIARKMTIPIHVLDVPALRRAAATTPPPIPKRKLWEKTMTELARKWCNPKRANEQYAFGVETQVWYYDGARVYFQIAAYTGDPKWEACALNLARQYRDFVVAAQGKVPGWRVFADGLRMAYERTKDESYRDAITLLVKNSPFTSQGGTLDPEGIRENAYAAEAFMNAEKAGAHRDPRLARTIDYILAYFDMWLVSKSWRGHQTFMDGLALEALIQYHQLTGDPRIPLMVKGVCDWIWESGWNHQIHQIIYNPEPAGPYCADGCQKYFTDLVNLVVPAFGWLFHLTGDARYQQEGDELFAHALDTDIDYSGKIFSQNYRWSFDYVRWRSGE